jgi:hypothetical protein
MLAEIDWVAWAIGGVGASLAATILAAIGRWVWQRHRRRFHPVRRIQAIGAWTRCGRRKRWLEKLAVAAEDSAGEFGPVPWSREEQSPGVHLVNFYPRGARICVPDVVRYRQIKMSGRYSPNDVEQADPSAASTDWSIAEIRKEAIRRGHQPRFRFFSDSAAPGPRPY